MIKIFAISAIAVLFFNGCTNIETETILVPQPYPVCNELDIYKVEEQELTNSVRPLDLAYLNAKKEQYKKVLDSYEKQTSNHNNYCKKMKEKYKEFNNDNK